MSLIHQTCTGEQVKLPLMPGAGENLPFAAPAILAGWRWQGGAAHVSAADGRQLVRADIEHGAVIAFDVEETDRAAIDLDDFLAAGRQFIHAHGGPALVSLKFTSHRSGLRLE